MFSQYDILQYGAALAEYCLEKNSDKYNIGHMCILQA